MEKGLINSRFTYVSYTVVAVMAIYQIASWEPVSNQSFFQRAFLNIFAPAQEIASTTKGSFQDFVDNYFFLVDVKMENESLKTEVLNLRNKVNELSEFELENKRLRSYLGYKKEDKLEKVFARVIAWDTYKDFRVMRINQGAGSGISLKDAVITPEGLIGSIHTLSRSYAEVLLINDVNSRVDIINKRTRARGIIEGSSDESLILKYSEHKEDYLRGDIVMTAGLGYLPKGIIVGRVTSIDDSAWISKKRIYLEPIVDLATIEDVIVLKKPQEPGLNNNDSDVISTGERP